MHLRANHHSTYNRLMQARRAVGLANTHLPICPAAPCVLPGSQPLITGLPGHACASPWQADDLANLQEVVGSSDATLLVRAWTGVIEFLHWGTSTWKAKDGSM